MFEQKFALLLEEQQKTASPRRLAMLQRDLSGTKRMLKVLWPALKTFDGITLEHEIVSISGVKIFIDAFYEPFEFALESDGFVAHAEKITRDRFDFERMRIRTIAKYSYKYVPFSRDELDKKPELCLQSFYELVGRHGANLSRSNELLSVYEREVIRLGMTLHRSFSFGELMDYLQLGRQSSRKIMRGLLDKEMILLEGGSKQRFYRFRLSERAKDWFICNR